MKNTIEKIYSKAVRERIEILNRIIIEGLVEKVTCEQRLEGEEGVSHVHISMGKGNSLYIDSGIGQTGPGMFEALNRGQNI